MAATLLNVLALPSPQYPTALGQWHQRFPSPIEWRLTAAGLQTRLAGNLLSTEQLAAPDSAQRALLASLRRRYGGLIDSASARYDVPAELLEATIATESGGAPDSIRFEPGYVSDERTPGRLSCGLMQTLISTAREALPQQRVTRAWLMDPSNSIEAGAAYIASQRARTSYDPPLVAAAYNAGSIVQEPTATRNPWRLKCYPLRTGKHVSRFCRHYNAAVALRPQGTP